MRAIRAMVAGLAMALAAPIAAQDALETRTVTDDIESPKATADQLDWLVGSWSGPGVRGAPAMESWTPPVGGTMVGTFIQKDADGAIMFTELMYIRPVEIAGGESLEIAIKHFNPDLTGWEEKDEVERFRLVAIEECAAYFQGLTIRCADKAAPHKGIIVAVRAGKDEAGKAKELVFRYLEEPDPLGIPVCDPEIISYTTCFGIALDDAEGRRKALNAKILAIHQELEVATDQFQASETAFEVYRKVDCPSAWSDPEGILCMLRLTNQRIETLENTWLPRLQP